MNRIINGISQSSVWYRRIVLSFWLIPFLMLITESLRAILSDKGLPGMDWRELFIQSLVLFMITGLLELASLVKFLRSDITLIVAADIIACFLLRFHTDIPVMSAILYLPMFISVISFQIRGIIFASILSAVSFTGMLLGITELRTANTSDNLIVIYAFLAGSSILSLFIVQRGKEFIRHLDEANHAHQELLVKNIIMDKLFKMDALTELYNHKTFHEYFEKLIDQCETNDLPLQLAILDLDNFKKVNDVFGHRVGDIILMRTAAVLRKAVTANDFVARYGGEEFAIIFTDKSWEESWKVLESVRAEMEAMLHEELGFKAVTCSIGLEAYKKGTGKEALFKNADMSLYAAKKRGKNQISSTEFSAMLTKAT